MPWSALFSLPSTEAGQEGLLGRLLSAQVRRILLTGPSWWACLMAGSCSRKCAQWASGQETLGGAPAFWELAQAATCRREGLQHPRLFREVRW